MNLLLTGATGFVGRNIVLEALGRYDRIFLPVRDAAKLERQLSAEGIVLDGKIIPLSADPAAWPSGLAVDHAILSAGVLFARDRDEYFQTNVDWKLRILRQLPATTKVVVLSSLSAGGPTPTGQSSRAESDPDLPLTWYGESKLAMERAIRAEFPDRFINILRPPMVLGARDAATLPLFRMARGTVRIKPGLHTKQYSFIAVEDLVEAIFAALALPSPLDLPHCYVASPVAITDSELIATAALSARGRGVTVPVPQVCVKILSSIVDAVPALRAQTPSLTRDRAREIWPARWVVNGTRFEQFTNWRARTSLREALQAAHDHYVREGSL